MDHLIDHRTSLGTKMNKTKSAMLSLATSLVCLGSAHSATVSIGFNSGIVHNASAISDAIVGGPQMAGMTVAMCFAGATTCEIASWGANGAAGGAGWSLQAGGTDTFVEPFLLNVAGRQLQSFTLYGLGGLTVFDTVLAPITTNTTNATANSSPGSGNGRPFTVESVSANVASIGVSYFDKVLVDGLDYLDLYLGMRVDFTMNQGFSGFSGELMFTADTDRVVDGGTLLPVAPTNPVPTPGTLALVGAALLGLGLVRARRA